MEYILHNSKFLIKYKIPKYDKEMSLSKKNRITACIYEQIKNTKAITIPTWLVAKKNPTVFFPIFPYAF